MYKNKSGQFLHFLAWDAANSTPKTSEVSNITGKVIIDGAPPLALNNTISEISTVDAPGMYRVALEQSETNGGVISFYLDSSTADVFIDPITIYPMNEIDLSGLSEVPVDLSPVINRISDLELSVSDVDDNILNVQSSLTGGISDIRHDIDDMKALVIKAHPSYNSNDDMLYVIVFVEDNGVLRTSGITNARITLYDDTMSVLHTFSTTSSTNGVFIVTQVSPSISSDNVFTMSVTVEVDGNDISINQPFSVLD